METILIPSRDHTKLRNIGTNTHAQIDASLLSAQTKLAELTVINGIIDIAESTISFVDGTRTFSLTPVGASFSFRAGGVKYTKTIAQTVVIPDVEGLYYIHFDSSGILQYQAFGEDVDNSINAYIANLYWDATNKTAIFLGDERHGIVMNAGTHHYLHDIFHARLESGLALGNITADGSGALDAHAEFSVGAGIIWDEDLEHSINAIGLPANIPIYYRTGASGYWRKKAKNNFPLIYKQAGTNARADYNQFTGGAWQLTEVANLDYLLVHYFATNNISDQIIGICGQNVYTSLALARAGADVEISSIVTSSLPTLEFVPIGTVIFQTATAYANTPASRIRTTTTGANYVDWRATTVTTLGGGGVVWGTIGGTISNQVDLQSALDAKIPFTGLSGSTLYGNSTSGGTLTLMSTSHATKGKILFGTSEYDEVNNRLGIGIASPSFPLDVSGQVRITFKGASSFFRIYNSTPSQIFAFGSDANHNGFFVGYDASGNAKYGFSGNGDNNYMLGANFCLGTTLSGTSATQTICVATGVAPTTSPADAFQMYSADIVAGNAAPHFRSESGDIVKLFKGAALTTALTTITFTAPGTPDYAVQDFTQTVPWGFASHDEANTVLSVIANSQARINDLETRLIAAGLLT